MNIGSIKQNAAGIYMGRVSTLAVAMTIALKPATAWAISWNIPNDATAGRQPVSRRILSPTTALLSLSANRSASE
ncbi:hypothetical protein [Sphingomonas sp. BK481]|uniref:hypothetical protein n=1 Tax=Sphingomonas sp. BK481 TaxID=2586981 RepID=UPI0017F5B480|nr:hypothetical protein [Sphingomonas sp. BK481]MBB3589440.1 uncharacterized protein (DUF736 family) [Sphingomonas sp. BK481]